MTGVKILASLQRISKALTYAHLGSDRLEYCVTRKEWVDLIRHMHFYGDHGFPALDAKELTYMGIKIRNPDALIS